MEGFGCVLAGVFGSGTGMTSYSNNVAAIAVTKVCVCVCVCVCEGEGVCVCVFKAAFHCSTLM